LKPIKFSFFALLLLCNYDGFGQWTEISNLDDRFIMTLSFLDDNLGYTLMNDNTGNAPAIMKTIDGGANWIEVSLPVQTGEFQDLYFYAEGEGVIVIRDLSNDVVPTKIFRTLNDGVNWEDISPDVTVNGVGVGQCQFLNQNIGFLATEKTLYTTMNGGEDWMSTDFNEYILSLDFLDADHGILGTWDGTFNYKGGMLTTTDGGLTWTNTLLDETYTSIVEVRQISNTIAYAAPIHSWAAIQAGYIYKSTDSGNSWNTIDIPMPDDDFTIRQIDFKDEMNGVVCVGNYITTKIYQTTNGGQTWVEEGEISSTNDSDLQLTPNSGYLGGKTGSFYKRSGTTSVKEAPAKIDVSIFPSPSKSGQSISWNSSERFTHLIIFDQTGTTIHQQSIHQDHTTLPHLSSGFYFVQLLSENGFTTAKLVVE
jgi:photosystem II stability/assembly factor-like uncharacterized protein